MVEIAAPGLADKSFVVDMLVEDQLKITYLNLFRYTKIKLIKQCCISSLRVVLIITQ